MEDNQSRKRAVSEEPEGTNKKLRSNNEAEESPGRLILVNIPNPQNPQECPKCDHANTIKDFGSTCESEDKKDLKEGQPGQQVCDDRMSTPSLQDLETSAKAQATKIASCVESCDSAQASSLSVSPSSDSNNLGSQPTKQPGTRICSFPGSQGRRQSRPPEGSPCAPSMSSIAERRPSTAPVATVAKEEDLRSLAPFLTRSEQSLLARLEVAQQPPPQQSPWCPRAEIRCRTPGSAPRSKDPICHCGPPTTPPEESIFKDARALLARNIRETARKRMGGIPMDVESGAAPSLKLDSTGSTNWDWLMQTQRTYPPQHPNAALQFQQTLGDMNLALANQQPMGNRVQFQPPRPNIDNLMPNVYGRPSATQFLNQFPPQNFAATQTQSPYFAVPSQNFGTQTSQNPSFSQQAALLAQQPQQSFGHPQATFGQNAFPAQTQSFSQQTQAIFPQPNPQLGMMGTQTTFGQNMGQQQQFQGQVPAPGQGIGNIGQGLGGGAIGLPGMPGQAVGIPGQNLGIQGYGAQGQSYGTQGQTYGNQGQGFGTQGQGYGTQGQGYGTQGQGYGTQGQGYGNQGQGYGNQGQGYAAQGQGYAAQGQGYAAQGQGYGTQGQSYGTQNMQGQGYGTQNIQSQGYGTQGFGTQGQGFGGGALGQGLSGQPQGYGTQNQGTNFGTQTQGLGQTTHSQYISGDPYAVYGTGAQTYPPQYPNTPGGYGVYSPPYGHTQPQPPQQSYGPAGYGQGSGQYGGQAQYGGQFHQTQQSPYLGQMQQQAYPCTPYAYPSASPGFCPQWVVGMQTCNPPQGFGPQPPVAPPAGMAGSGGGGSPGGAQCVPMHQHYSEVSASTQVEGSAALALLRKMTSTMPSMDDAPQSGQGQGASPQRGGNGSCWCAPASNATNTPSTTATAAAPGAQPASGQTALVPAAKNGTQGVFCSPLELTLRSCWRSPEGTVTACERTITCAPTQRKPGSGPQSLASLSLAVAVRDRRLCLWPASLQPHGPPGGNAGVTAGKQFFGSGPSPTPSQEQTQQPPSTPQPSMQQNIRATTQLPPPVTLNVGPWLT